MKFKLWSWAGAALLPLAASGAWAGPTLGDGDGPTGVAGPASSPGLSDVGSAKGGGARIDVSTGNRSLDLLLEARLPGQGASAAPASGRTAAPALREADLRQAIRAEAAAQAASKSGARAGAEELLGGSGRVLQSDDQAADPSLRRRWDGGHHDSTPSQAGAQSRASESQVVQTLREIADFLRSHRIELFAGLGLMVVVGVLFKLRSRSL